MQILVIFKWVAILNCNYFLYILHMAPCQICDFQIFSILQVVSIFLIVLFETPHIYLLLFLFVARGVGVIFNIPPLNEKPQRFICFLLRF